MQNFSDARYRCNLAFLIALFAFQIQGLAQDRAEETPRVVFAGSVGPGHGKNIVFVTGDDEYYSEEGMPVIARILAERHGFRCTVLFPINKSSGVIDPRTRDNIPGLEALATADLMVIFTRFRSLPDEQMQRIVSYLDSGKAVMGLRTATHAFKFQAGSASAKYGFASKDPAFMGGFGKQVLGETWIAHHGNHGSQSTRGLLAPEAAGNPILRGIRDGDIWSTSDVYEVRIPIAGAMPLIYGQVLAGMNPADQPAPPVVDPKRSVTVDKNNPMMPIAWTRSYIGPSGRTSRIFTTTMGGAMGGQADWENEGMRRLLVNAVYWSVGMEDQVPERANVDGLLQLGFKRGTRPSEVAAALPPLRSNP